VNDTVTIYLVQHKANTNTGGTDRLYRLDKLVGAVEVLTGGDNVRSFHVGDVLSEREASSVARIPHYRVVVTEHKPKEAK